MKYFCLLVIALLINNIALSKSIEYFWFDEGKENKININISTDQLIFFDQKLSEDDIFNKLKKEGKELYPSTNFTMKKSFDTQTLVSNNDIALAWGIKRYKELLNESIKQKHLIILKDPYRKYWLMPDYKFFAANAQNNLKDLNTILQSKENTKDSKKSNSWASVYINFVQNLENTKLVSQYPYRNLDFMQVEELLLHKKGNSDSKALLLLALLENRNPNIPKILIFTEDKCYIGLANKKKNPNEINITYNKINYVLIDPSSKGNKFDNFELIKIRSKFYSVYDISKK